jgi:hypothetical protein
MICVVTGARLAARGGCRLVCRAAGTLSSPGCRRTTGRRHPGDKTVAYRVKFGGAKRFNRWTAFDPAEKKFADLT